MTVIRTPKGLVRFPTDMSQDDILAVLRKEFPSEQPKARPEFFDTASEFFEAGKEVREKTREVPVTGVESFLSRLGGEILPFYGGAAGGIADVAGSLLYPSEEAKSLPLAGYVPLITEQLGQLLSPGPMSRETAERKLARDIFALGEVAIPELARPTAMLTTKAIQAATPSKPTKLVDEDIAPVVDEVAPVVEKVEDLPLEQIDDVKAVKDETPFDVSPVTQAITEEFDISKPIRITKDFDIEVPEIPINLSQVLPQELRVTEEVLGDAYKVGYEMLDEAKIDWRARKNRDGTSVKNQVIELMSSSIIPPDRMAALANKYDMSVTDFTQKIFGDDVRDWGLKGLAMQAGKKAEAFDIINPSELPKEPWSSKFYERLKKAERNTISGLVSPIATAARNTVAQIPRAGLDVFVRAIDSSLASAFGGKPVNYTSSLALLSGLTKNTKDAKKLAKLLTEQYPTEKSKMYNRYAGDVSVYEGAARRADIGDNGGPPLNVVDLPGQIVDKGLDVWGKGVDTLNFLNKVSEYHYRNAYFYANILDKLSKKGVKKDKLFAPESLRLISKQDVEDAVSDALYGTYSKDIPKTNLMGQVYSKITDGIGAIPFAQLYAGIPFPRFLYNSLDYFYQHSPAGVFTFAGDLLSDPKLIKNLFKDEAGRKKLSKLIAGSSLFGAAYYAVDKGLIGENWFEYKDSETGEMIDVRPYDPLSKHFLIAKILHDYMNDLPNMDILQILDGLTGVRLAPGQSTGVTAIDSLWKNLTDVAQNNKGEAAALRLLDKFVSAALTPLRNWNDFVQQDQTFRQNEPTGNFFNDLLEQSKRNIPFQTEDLPEVEYATRAGPKGRPEDIRIPFTEKQYKPIEVFGVEIGGPFIRQLTGVTRIAPKNVIEKELDRLKFKPTEIYRGSGNKKFDNIVKRNMGPMVETFGSYTVQLPSYQALTNEQKALVLKTDVIQPIRTLARDMAKAEANLEYQKIKYSRMGIRERRVIETTPGLKEALTKAGIIED